MFGVGLELLSGRYIATAYNDRDRVEWPPHPARLFSALVAVWAEADPSGQAGRQELAALHWLERQAPPSILASPHAKAGVRDVVTVFVPVNDVGMVSAPDRVKLDQAIAAFEQEVDSKSRSRAEKAVKRLEAKFEEEARKAIAAPTQCSKKDMTLANQLLGDRRKRQPRTFPSATPECSSVGFVWPDVAPPAEALAAIAQLLSRLVRLGHSSSLVRACLLDSGQIEALSARTTRFLPDEEGDLSIRWVGPGQVDQLDAEFARHRETEPHVLPARFARYREGEREPATPITRGIFGDDLIVLARVGGPRLPVTSVVGLATQMRRALMSHADEPIHEVLSGHEKDGSASEAPHLAVVPLPVVFGPHADGAILGIALVLPTAADEAGRRAVIRALGRMEQSGLQGRDADAPILTLLLGDAGELELQRVAWGEDRRTTLRPASWCRASKRWATATPIALDRNPGDLHDPQPEKRKQAFQEATASLVESVRRIGLPAPAKVDVLRSCVLPGSAKPRSYPRYPIDSRRPQRVLVHARLVFDDMVKGPLILGSGRYHGLGLCLPVDDHA